MMKIIPMTDAHVDAVVALEAICFADPWSANSVASELTNPLSCWLVALEADTVVGYIGSQTVMGETDMMNVAVHPDHRRKGVAVSLIHALVQKLKECGSHCLTLEVRASNVPAIALYEKLGFAEVGRRRNYYRNPKEDALILRKEWEL
jgi:ribosomal-protein-alanine N-acetyltransferase